MSAFIVQDSVINRIVSYFNREVVGRYGREYSPVPEALERRGIEVDSYDKCEALALQMRALNEQAVRCRYADRYHETFSPSPFTFSYDDGAKRPVQLYKLLQCWLYQCSEGDCIESALYKNMDEVADGLAHHIVRNLPEYSAEAWGE